MAALGDGFKRGLPIVLGYVPVSFAFGVLAVKNGFPPSLAIALSVFQFAGSGQFVTAGLCATGVGVLSVTVSVFVVNLRHLLMSASLALHLRPLTLWQKFLFGYEMTDETFGVHATAFQKGWSLSLATLYSCNITAHSSWVLGTILGAYCGGLIQDVRPLGLDYALTAMFIALLVPQCRSALHVLVGAFSMVLCVGLKVVGMTQWNVVTAAVAGACLGVVLLRAKKAADARALAGGRA